MKLSRISPISNAKQKYGPHGLMEFVKSAVKLTAVAGVLAHEIGHVDSRDVTRNALRVAGTAGLLSMAIGDIAGGAVIVGVAQAVIDTSYTREAEVAADRFAVEMLDAAGVSAEGFAAFFEVLKAEEGRINIDIPEWISTHPDTAGRAQIARSFAEGQGVTSPVLNDDDWSALKDICNRDS